MGGHVLAWSEYGRPLTGREKAMRAESCYKCIYAWFDPEEWPPQRRQEVHAQWQKENSKRKGKRRKAKATSVKRHAKTPARKLRKRPACKAKRTVGRSRR